MAKITYLTIDDGPSENTAKYIEYLDNNAISAILFFIGENINKFPDVAITAVKKGFIIGNHTMHHCRLSECSINDAIRDIELMESLINNIYKEAQCKRVAKVFRYPYGDKGGMNKASIQNYLKTAGFNRIDPNGITYSWYYEMGLDRDLDVLWTFDFEDYKLSKGENGISKDGILKRISEKEPFWGGSLQNEHSHDILLIHDLPKSNTFYHGYFTDILDNVRNRGITFRRPSFI